MLVEEVMKVDGSHGNVFEGESFQSRERPAVNDVFCGGQGRGSKEVVDIKRVVALQGEAVDVVPAAAKAEAQVF